MLHNKKQKGFLNRSCRCHAALSSWRLKYAAINANRDGYVVKHYAPFAPASEKFHFGRFPLEPASGNRYKAVLRPCPPLPSGPTLSLSSCEIIAKSEDWPIFPAAMHVALMQQAHALWAVSRTCQYEQK
jgi:hypothetical protein